MIFPPELPEQPKASTSDQNRQALIDILAGSNAGSRAGLDSLTSPELLKLVRTLGAA